MIGLREKREPTPREPNELTRRFFRGLLCRAQEALREVETVLVVGCSFSPEDAYLRDYLSCHQVSAPPRLVVCYKADGRDRGYEDLVQGFFGTSAEFLPQGFSWTSLPALEGVLSR